MAFYPQTNSQTEKINNIITAYFWAFIDFEQDDWVKFISIAKLIYNNIKNASAGYILFKLNCGYYP